MERQCSLLLLSITAIIITESNFISLFKGYCHKVILSKLGDQHYNSHVQLLVKYDTYFFRRVTEEAFPTEFQNASASHFLISRQDLFFPYVR